MWAHHVQDRPIINLTSFSWGAMVHAGWKPEQTFQFSISAVEGCTPWSRQDCGYLVLWAWNRKEELIDVLVDSTLVLLVEIFLGVFLIIPKRGFLVASDLVDEAAGVLRMFLLLAELDLWGVLFLSNDLLGVTLDKDALLPAAATLGEPYFV